MTVRQIDLPYAAGGTNMVGTLFLPEASAPAPGILVFPEAFGLAAHALEIGRELAELGFAALACDYYGDRRQFTDMGDVVAAILPLRDQDRRAVARARGQAALACLAARPEVDGSRIAAVGYCFGGVMALELARSGAAIRGAVGVHSTLSHDDPAPRNMPARILAIIGADDPSVPPAERLAFEEEMRAAAADWRLHVYGGVVHSFTDRRADARGMPDMLRYDESAHRRSWRETVDFFREVLG